jgi:GT2 family glycosyltransferase
VISVVIPTRNKASRLHLTLSCLASQWVEDDWEVIVVNDGSTDETGTVLNSMQGIVPLRRINGPQGGRAAARNTGAAVAKGDVLLFLDDDVLTQPSFVDTHNRHHKRIPGLAHGKLRELIGAAKVTDPRLGGPGFPPLSPEMICRQGFSLKGLRVSTNALERAIERMYEQNGPKPVPWLVSVGANLSVSMNVWHSVCGFDETFGTGWGCEDLEFGFRARQMGVALSFLPDAMGIHLTHHNPARWTEHHSNLQHFMALHPLPEVDALALLLSPEGSIDEYFIAQAGPDSGTRQQGASQLAVQADTLPK